MKNIEVIRYFTTWPSKPYKFVDEDTRARFLRLVSTPRPAIVLTELRTVLDEFYEVGDLDIVPRSKYQPCMLLEPCRKFETGGNMPAIHYNDYKRACAAVRSKFRQKARAIPLNLSDVPFDGSKNSGLPYLQKKQDVYDVTLKRAVRCTKGACPPPMVMFHRGKDLKKVRPVFALPFEWHLVEGKFFYPLQELILSRDNPYLVGRWAAGVGARLNSLVVHSTNVICMDYSGFDGSLSGQLVNSSFQILHSMMRLQPEDDELWKRVVAYFITSPIVAPDGRVYSGRRHGVPSGSMFTQLIDTICNAIIIEYVAQRTGLHLGQYYCVGDDSVIGVMNDEVNIHDIVTAASEIGIRVSKDKTKVLPADENCSPHFLGHGWGTGLGERPVEETLTRLLSPERIRREYFSKDQAIRYAAYRERIRAYQEDSVNRKSWAILRVLETRIIHPSLPRNLVRYRALDADRHQNIPTTETVERDRWDKQRAELRADKTISFVRVANYFA